MSNKEPTFGEIAQKFKSKSFRTPSAEQVLTVIVFNFSTWLRFQQCKLELAWVGNVNIWTNKLLCICSRQHNWKAGPFLILNSTKQSNLLIYLFVYTSKSTMKLKDNFQGKRSDENIFLAEDRKIFLKDIFRRTAIFYCPTKIYCYFTWKQKFNRSSW